MTRDRIIQLLAVLVAVLSLGASAGLAVQLSASAGRNRLVYTDTAEAGQPKQVALGIAMGAFRGMFVNYLWIRANHLKEEGRYHESIELSRVITALQPRFPQVWVFHAWNMAYNISVQTLTNRERWKWVTAGIDLLRQKGVPANPNDLIIHKELAWIFLHKIGGYTDDANMYYKRQLAAEWTMALGQPPLPDPRDRDDESAKKKWMDWLRPIVEAPSSIEDAIAAEPGVRALVDALKAQTNFDPDFRVVQNYTVMTAILASAERALIEPGFDDRRKKFVALIEDPAHAKAWPVLIAHLRRRHLIEHYHMEPARMLRYTQMFGPLDWRHHASHALYWAQTGVENALTRWTAENRKDFDFVNSGRMVNHALQDLWRTGDLYFDFFTFVKNPEDERVFYRGSPSINFIASYGEHLTRLVDEIAQDKDAAPGQLGLFENTSRRYYTLYAAGYENFMKDAIRFTYRRGDIARANKLKDDLYKWPHHNRNDPDRDYILTLSVDKFVEKELEDQLSRPSVAREEIVGALQNAYLQGLGNGDTEQFTQQMQYAGAVHRLFFKQQPKGTQVDPNAPRMAQMDKDFKVVAGSEFALLCMVVDLDKAEAMYDRAPADLKPWAYDLLAERFRAALDETARREQAAGRQGRTFDQIFPEPPGMAAHRQMIQAKRREAEQRTPDILSK